MNKYYIAIFLTFWLQNSLIGSQGSLKDQVSQEEPFFLSQKKALLLFHMGFSALITYGADQLIFHTLTQKTINLWSSYILEINQNGKNFNDIKEPYKSMIQKKAEEISQEEAKNFNDETVINQRYGRFDAFNKHIRPELEWQARKELWLHRLFFFVTLDTLRRKTKSGWILPDIISPHYYCSLFLPEWMNIKINFYGVQIL